MRYKVIACSVFFREISLLAARSSAVLDVTWIRQGLHNYPDLLRREVQREIDRTENPEMRPDQVARPPEEYAAIILGFGLCSRAVSGLRTTRLPLILPRAHDCIAILLGSHGRYSREFNAAPGTYWFSPGWIEQSVFPSGSQCALLRSRFAELYDEDNAEYLVELERDSLSSYTRAARIVWPELDRGSYRERVTEIARDFGWEMAELQGDPGMLTRILEGDWREEEVAICTPGHTLEVGEEDDVVACVPVQRETPTGAAPAGGGGAPDTVGGAPAGVDHTRAGSAREDAADV